MGSRNAAAFQKKETGWNRMSIDVKMAAAKLDLKEKNVLKSVNSFYQIPLDIRQYVQRQEGKSDIGNGREIGFLKRNNTDMRENECQIVMQGGMNFGNSSFEYNSTSTSMDAIFVNNPSIPGVMGVRCPLMQNKRYFFSTGQLSGCGVAMLMQAEKIYFIHAGASSGGVNNAITPEERRRLINRDIFRMAQLLSSGADNYAQGITKSELRDLLAEQNFKGVVLNCGVNEDINKSIEDPITMLEYSAEISLSFHNLIGVANAEGMCVGVRSIIPNEKEVKEAAQYKYTV